MRIGIKALKTDDEETGFCCHISNSGYRLPDYKYSAYRPVLKNVLQEYQVKRLEYLRTFLPHSYPSIRK